LSLSSSRSSKQFSVLKISVLKLLIIIANWLGLQFQKLPVEKNLFWIQLSQVFILSLIIVIVVLHVRIMTPFFCIITIRFSFYSVSLQASLQPSCYVLWYLL
jgi:hypothetical protein